MNNTKDTRPLHYEMEQLVNGYGSGYGWVYRLTIPTGVNPIRWQTRLIEEVIGDDYYYGHRDIWNQIHIDFVQEES